MKKMKKRGPSFEDRMMMIIYSMQEVKVNMAELMALIGYLLDGSRSLPPSIENVIGSFIGVIEDRRKQMGIAPLTRREREEIPTLKLRVLYAPKPKQKRKLVIKKTKSSK